LRRLSFKKIGFRAGRSPIVGRRVKTKTGGIGFTPLFLIPIDRSAIQTAVLTVAIVPQATMTAVEWAGGSNRFGLRLNSFIKGGR
jgi:hypothetical protein